MAAIPNNGNRKRDLRIALSLRGKAAAVYKALTSARELCYWWLQGAETDAKNGGRFRMVWPKIGNARSHAAKERGFFPPQAAAGEGQGTFVDLEPGRKVSWLWRLSAYKRRRLPALTSFVIAPAGRGSCELTLLHKGFSGSPEAQETFRRCELWWGDCLAKLKLYLETGKVRKTEFLFLDAPKAAAKKR